MQDRRATNVALVLVGLSLAGGYCGDPPKDAMRVENRTDRMLYLFYINDEGREVRIGTSTSDVSPGGEVPFRIEVDGRELECTPGGLVAKSRSGAVVGRRSQPLCRRETWVIEE